jgi:ZIP family zinc transporter
MPLWLQAGGWGILAGLGLLLGAAIGYFLPLSHRFIAGVMAFGSGVLISVLTFGLMEEAYESGGFAFTAFGFFAGAALFCLVNWFLSAHGAANRKRCGECVRQPSESENEGSGLAIAAGALLDGIPESVAIGMSIGAGGGAVLVGFLIANIPQALSSTAGMKQAGRSSIYIFGIWSTITVLSAIAAVLGFLLKGNLSPQMTAAVTALAAGAVLAMLAETMIPEAFFKFHNFIGLITVVGFLLAFVITKLAH